LSVASIVGLLAAMSHGSAIVLPAGDFDPGSVDPAGAATVVYTSGTAAEPKGVRLTKSNWTAAVDASAWHLGHDVDDTWILAMPLHHVGGMSILLRTAYVGSRLRLLPGFEPESFVIALRSGVTLVSVVATMLERILDVDSGPYTGLKAVLVGGGPIPDGLLERAHAAGLPAIPTYGMTETCGQVATLRPGSDLDYKVHPLPGVEISTEEDGRIRVRGAMVSPGYVGEPDRSSDDWFVTGDAGSLDPDGALRVIGRADDLIITGGENVSPARVEAVLVGHPAVTAALVVGVPSPTWGMEIGSIYVGDVEPRELRDWAKKRLAGFMIPRRWLAVDAIPLGTLHKPDRAAAVELLLGS
jgi:O-succinylbenzoic acid--CoA ligase